MNSRRTFLAGLAGTAAAGAAWSCGKSMDEPEATPTSSADGAREADANAATDELFAELRDQSGEVDPISPAEHAARRQRLGALLSDSPFDAMICEGGATMRYLSGTSWGHSERLFSLVVLADGSPRRPWKRRVSAGSGWSRRCVIASCMACKKRWVDRAWPRPWTSSSSCAGARTTTSWRSCARSTS
jgi:hypothetical protein